MTERALSLIAVLCAGLLMLGAVPAAAQQTGSIAGVVVDGGNGETLPGANVAIQETSTGTSTDLNGRYRLKGLDPGAYTVVFSFVGFQRKTVTGVEVTAGQTTKLDVTLQTAQQQLDEVVISAEAAKDTEAGLLKERQKAAGVSDAISAEAIGRSGAGNVADAVKKITGASLVGGKYVNVRGLQGRYVSTQLNGSSLPSTDPDGQSVALDIFPANLIDNVVTTKSFTPDKPGEFTGGAINISTKSLPDEFFLNASVSVSANTEVGVGGQVLQPVGGLDAIPSVVRNNDLPDALSVAFNDDDEARLLDEATRAFATDMTPDPIDAIGNRSAEISFGNQFEVFGDRPLGIIASASYDRSYSGYEGGTTARFEQTGQSVEDLQPTARYATQVGTKETLYGGLLGLSFQPAPKHELGARILYNADDEESARFDTGRLVRDLTGGQIFQTRTMSTIERTMASGELSGTHQFGDGADPVRVEWKTALSRAERDEPDFRVFSNHFDDSGGETTYFIARSIYNPAVARYFRDLTEESWVSDLSVEVPIGEATITAGGRYNTKARDFRERRFDYFEDQERFEGDPNEYVNQKAGLIGEDDRGRNRFGTYVSDETQSDNNYDADKQVGAGFAMAEIPVPGLPGVEFIGGVRVEQSTMSITTLGNSSGRFEQTDILPSANLVWALRDDMNLRTAYGRTVARPTFREFAPFASFNFVGDYIERGNADLNRTLVDNVDLRWEWFANPGELYSVSAFYKSFEDPIERTIDPRQGSNVEVTYENKDNAYVYGLEVELRKRLGFIAPWLEYAQVGGNLTLTQSAVTRDSIEIDAIKAYNENPSDTRQLQGQSPYILNLNAGYENPETGTSVNVFFNRFGDRLQTVTRNGVDLFEQGRNILDVMVSQRIVENIRAKASVKNVLDAREVISQQFRGQQFVNDSRPMGRSVSVGLSYSF